MSLRDSFLRRLSAFAKGPEAIAGGKFEVKAAAEDGAVEVLIYDEIGFWGVTAKAFAEALGKITADRILVRINSPGGDVFDGIAIYNTLRAHGAKIDVRVDGIAASAASVIAMAGQDITMARGSMMMIHDPWTIAMGSASEFRALADVLEKIGDQLVAIYAARTNRPLGEVKAIMAAETWYSAEDAKENGFADTIEEAETPGASAEAALARKLYGKAEPSAEDLAAAEAARAADETAKAAIAARARVAAVRRRHLALNELET